MSYTFFNVIQKILYIGLFQPAPAFSQKDQFENRIIFFDSSIYDGFELYKYLTSFKLSERFKPEHITLLLYTFV